MTSFKDITDALHKLRDILKSGKEVEWGFPKNSFYPVLNESLLFEKELSGSSYFLSLVCGSWSRSIKEDDLIVEEHLEGIRLSLVKLKWLKSESDKFINEFNLFNNVFDEVYSTFEIDDSLESIVTGKRNEQMRTLDSLKSIIDILKTINASIVDYENLLTNMQNDLNQAMKNEKHILSASSETVVSYYEGVLKKYMRELCESI